MVICRILYLTTQQTLITARFVTLGLRMDIEASSSKGFKTKSEIKDLIDQSLIAKWENKQHDLRGKIVQNDTTPWQEESQLKGLNFVAGLDISYPVEAAYTETQTPDCTAFAAIVILSYPASDVVHRDIQRIQLNVPYVPGFLAFRESSPLVELVQKTISTNPEMKPDVLIVDGNGILHPQQCGSACHIGFHTGIPTIGVAKNLHRIEGLDCETNKVGQGMLRVGDYVYLRDSRNHILGMALKTASEAKNPVYVSVGHKISLETARRVVLAVSKYRVPEPIRFADSLSREFIRKTEEANLKLKSHPNKS